MLPDIHLDQDTFEELMEKAKRRIVGCYPKWTDFNYHDPGFTLAELFAWLTEIQQYELDHIGDAHRRQYLKLLGESCRHGQPAGAYVCVQPEEALNLPAGSRLDASGVLFETVEDQLLPGTRICSAFGFLEERVSYVDEEQLQFRNSVEFYPFGRKAEAGTGFYLKLSGPLPVGERIYLTVRAGGQGYTPRNPADETAIPLAKITWRFWNGSAWRQLEILRDETFGLLLDGQMVFCLDAKMKERTVDGEKGWYLRAQLEESQYEFPPVLSFLDLNTLHVFQKETVAAWLPGKVQENGSVAVRHGLCVEGLAEMFRQEEGLFFPIGTGRLRWKSEKGEALIWPEEGEKPEPGCEVFVLVHSAGEWYRRHRVIGQGYGLPEQKFYLEETGFLWEDFEILVEEADRPGAYRKWEKRADFAHTGPEDCHYCIDGKTGQIVFGDCEHGMAPEGNILLISYSRSLGDAGNVKADKIRRLFPDGDKEIAVSNPWDALGGRNEESVEEALARVRFQLGDRSSMVTVEDYEREVRRTPGLRIESCRAAVQGDGPGGQRSGNIMQIVVRPCSLEKRPKLTEAFVRNIMRFLERKRLLGVEIRIQSPVYIRLRVDLEVVVHPQYQDVQERIEEAAARYLQPLVRQFAGTVSYSGLYGYIDRLDCVAGIRSLVLDAKGNGVRRDSYGDLIFPGNGIADEIEINCSCSVRE